MGPFSDLGLVEPLTRALHERHHHTPTPIQAQAIPPLLEGRDVLGCARTGTGKTAAFALPILQRLAHAASHARGRAPRALVLVPTRELATQVADSFVAYGRHVAVAIAKVYGGVGQGPQVSALERGVDVLVATPGRLLDLMDQRHAHLGHVEVVVLDEADHMLDLGFMPAVRRILAALPRQRQTLLFSATMPPPIAQLAKALLHRPVEVFVTPPASTVDAVAQQVHHVARPDKLPLLAHLLREPAVARALVFTRTKHGADKVARWLVRERIAAEAIHGNKSQNAREHTLHGFRGGRVRVLVATDIAARGIDVDGVTHVVNFDLPNVPETYVHRIGRTARAGASGVAISLCDPEERPFLREVEKLMRRSVPVAAPIAIATSHASAHPPRPEPRPQHTARPAHAPHGSHSTHAAPHAAHEPSRSRRRRRPRRHRSFHAGPRR